MGFSNPDPSTGAHAFYWGVTFSGVLGNWQNSGLGVASDGGRVTNGTVDDNSGGVGTHGIVFAHFAPDASSITDSTFGNSGPFGALDDYGTGVAVGTSLFGSTYYFDGWTTSTDFTTTPPVYQGADPDPTAPSQGWVGNWTPN